MMSLKEPTVKLTEELIGIMEEKNYQESVVKRMKAELKELRKKSNGAE